MQPATLSPPHASTISSASQASTYPESHPPSPNDSPASVSQQPASIDVKRIAFGRRVERRECGHHHTRPHAPTLSNI